MKNSMVAHLWANEKQESAYGSHFYFEGESIYSWGDHFEAGRIVRNKRGEKAYLINDEYYSGSTACHQAYVRNAIPTGAKVFNVGYDIGDKGNISFVTRQLEIIKKRAEEYKRVRTEINYRYIWDIFKNLMGYIEFFNMSTPKQLMRKSADEWLGAKHELSWKSDKEKREYVGELKRIFKIMLDHQALEVLGTINVIVDDICGDGTWAGYIERCERYRRKKEEKESERIKKYAGDTKEKIEKWKRGELGVLNIWGYIPYDEPNVWLRIRNDKVETSKEIEISKEEAGRLWKIIKYFHNGNTFKQDIAKDIRGNKWLFNSYQNDLLIAGCHRIAYSEMEDIAKQLGLE